MVAADAGWADDAFGSLGGGSNGAVERNRTSDLLITNQLLYRLSYNGETFTSALRISCSTD